MTIDSTAVPPEVAEVRPGEALDWPRLGRYLRDHLEHLDGEMLVLQFPNGSANLTYLVQVGETRLVVRRPPFGVIAPGAHDMKREFRALSELSNDYNGPYRSASCSARGGVMDVEAAVRGLLDREAIRETLYRYASTIDRKDWKGLREVFVEDAVITMVGGVRTEGAGAIVEYIERRCRKRVWQHHLLSVYEVVLDGDEARTLTYHTSHQSTEAKPEHVLQLVARYHDRLRREGDQWKIAEKHMELGWYEERLRVADGDLLQP